MTKCQHRFKIDTLNGVGGVGTLTNFFKIKARIYKNITKSLSKCLHRLHL